MSSSLYGLTLVTILLLFIAAILIAVVQDQESKHKKSSTYYSQLLVPAPGQSQSGPTNPQAQCKGLAGNSNGAAANTNAMGQAIDTPSPVDDADGPNGLPDTPSRQINLGLDTPDVFNLGAL
jgi:hypothetical protein